MNTRPFYFGLIFIAIIAILANYLGNTDFSHHYHISALIIAILLGMAIGNTIYPQFSTRVEKGVLFAKGTLLRTGIVLYGFRLTFGDIADVGLNAVVTDAIMLISTFFFTALLGIRYLINNWFLSLEQDVVFVVRQRLWRQSLLPKQNLIKFQWRLP